MAAQLKWDSHTGWLLRSTGTLVLDGCSSELVLFCGLAAGLLQWSGTLLVFGCF